MDEIKDAFDRVKEDIIFLKKELFLLRKELRELKTRSMRIETQTSQNWTDSFLNKTDRHSFKPRNSQNWGISTGNEGVWTDRQTDRQTDKSTEKEGFSGSFDQAVKALDSLDIIKKEIKVMFKGLTPQEVLVFSTIYQIGEEEGHCTYRDVSLKLGLTESSIREYVRRLLLKGIPLDKVKENNKEIFLKVPDSLKRVASLKTILSIMNS